MFIKYYDTTSKKNGYNCTDGGDGTCGYDFYAVKTDEEIREIKEKISKSLKGRVCSDETKYKISKSKIGKSCSEETKQKLSEANIGKKQSEETKAKRSKSLKGKTSGNKHYKTVPVICITTGEIFDTMHDAELKYLISYSNIDKCCRKIKYRKSAGKLPDGTKLEWKYYNINNKDGNN